MDKEAREREKKARGRQRTSKREVFESDTSGLRNETSHHLYKHFYVETPML